MGLKSCTLRTKVFSVIVDGIWLVFSVTVDGIGLVSVMVDGKYRYLKMSACNKIL